MKVRLIPPCDTLVGDGDALMLYPDQLIRLSGLGTAIAELANDPISVSTLSSELVERFGRPGGIRARHATQAIVDELVEHGVLEII